MMHDQKDLKVIKLLFTAVMNARGEASIDLMNQLKEKVDAFAKKINKDPDSIYLAMEITMERNANQFYELNYQNIHGPNKPPAPEPTSRPSGPKTIM